MSERNKNSKNVDTKTITSTDQKYNNNNSNNNNNNQSSTKRSSFFSSSSNKNNRKTAQMTQQQQPSQSGCWFGIFATGKNLFCEVNMSGDKPNLADLAQQEPSGGKFIIRVRERGPRSSSSLQGFLVTHSHAQSIPPPFSTLHHRNNNNNNNNKQYKAFGSVRSVNNVHIMIPKTTNNNNRTVDGYHCVFVDVKIHPPPDQTMTRRDRT
jgi:DNA mismatch repair ATPase MutL